MLIFTSEAWRVIEKVRTALPQAATKVAFITTAGNPDRVTPWIELDRNALLTNGFLLDELDFAEVKDNALRERLELADIIFICGGNTFYLLQESNKSGFSAMLPELVRSGKHYIGSSAGSLLVGPSLECIRALDDPGKAPELDTVTAIGLVPFVPLVHFGRDEYSRQYLETFKCAYCSPTSIISIRDTELLIWENDSLRWA